MKSKFTIILLCQFLISFGQNIPLITDIPNRHITSLNGKWNIIIDPYETGFFDYRFEESSRGFFLNQKPKDKTDLIEYDFDKSECLNVPGDWNSQKPELLYYEGSIWYKNPLTTNSYLVIDCFCGLELLIIKLLFT